MQQDAEIQYYGFLCLIQVHGGESVLKRQQSLVMKFPAFYSTRKFVAGCGGYRDHINPVRTL
jgi:hypothetical protein